MNAKTIAYANQKGGVGKTTTCANLGIGLALEGKKPSLIRKENDMTEKDIVNAILRYFKSVPDCFAWKEHRGYIVNEANGFMS